MKNIRRKNLLLRAVSLTAALSLCTAMLLIPALAGGSAPIAENLEFKTYKNVPVTGCLAATDPDGEEITYAIASEPKKGSVSLSDKGEFTYTPNKGKKGGDSFCYTASDPEGNISNKATVSIEIQKQSTSVSYSDMDGSDAYYAALCLAEEGIFVGEKLGGSYFFTPEANVTRSEFLAMCMDLSGAELLSGVTKTGFYDDSAISQWAKPYVSTALMAGLISGSSDESGNPVFLPDENVTMAEAAVMLNNVLEISDVTQVGSFADSAVIPAWASQAAANLRSCDIIPSGVDYSESLTRAQAAKLLVNAKEVLSSRSCGSSLLTWAS